MTPEKKQELEARCLRFRRELIQLLHRIQTGHPGGSLSCTEILTTLYGVIMNYDAKDPKKEGRDRLILSKGHAAPHALSEPGGGRALPQGGAADLAAAELPAPGLPLPS